MNLFLKWTPIAIGVLLAIPASAQVNKINSAPSEMTVLDKSNSELNLLIQQAIANDLKRESLFKQSKAIQDQGIANSTFMDPKLRLGAANVPVDSWSFTDDAMTNIAVGIGQQFPRGDTLDLQKQRSFQQAESTEISADLRALNITRSICQLWLKLGYFNQVDKNLKQRISLQKELVRYNQTNYSLGNKSAQDILNAELQITRLEEKRDANIQQQKQGISQLSEWLGIDWTKSGDEKLASNQLKLALLDPKMDSLIVGDHYEFFRNHPLVQIAQKNIQMKETEVEIKKEAFKPQFGVEVSYGYRQAKSMAGGDASDVMSAFLTLDVPLFTKNKQDRALSSTQYQLGSSRLERDLLLQNMNAKANDVIEKYNGLASRTKRYRDSLLPQSESRLKAVQRGYDANTATFSELISARLDDLSLQLEYQSLITEKNQAKADLAYWFNGFGFSSSTKSVQF